MTGFLDIAKRQKMLTIAGQPVNVAALSLGDIADLALRFKPFRDLISRNPAFNVGELLKLGGPVVAGLIAAAIGKLGDAAYETKAAELSAGEQSMLLLTLYEVSFPEDIRAPFGEQLERLFNISRLWAASDPPPDTSSDAATVKAAKAGKPGG